MDFTDGPLANCKPPQVALWLCGPLWALGQGAGGTWRPPPVRQPQGGSGQRLGHRMWPWLQQEAWKIRKMRSLQSGRVGCDTGEEWGAQRNKELL